MRAMLSGTRLAYVVVPIEGTVRRPKHQYIQGKGIVVQEVEQPGGFLAYFPRGHVIRIRNENELRHYKLNRKPKVINLQGLSDPSSPLGALMMAQDEDGRRRAYRDLEKQVIDLATIKCGRGVMPEMLREEDHEDEESGPRVITLPANAKPRRAAKRRDEEEYPPRPKRKAAIAA